MQARIGQLDETSSDRIAQLFAKTNQFNLTTRRHSASALKAVANSDDGAIHWLRLSDRFGDLGLTAVGVVLRREKQAVIESLVMSCRVANRNVEQAMVSVLAEQARVWGCEVLIGEFVPTDRNHVVADLYQRLGFERDQQSADLACFRVELGETELPWPETIERIES